MPEEEEGDLLEIKFRLFDGSDIGPFRYATASTVAMLKERILTDWPKDKKGGPKSANDVKLINAGKILENNKTWPMQNSVWRPTRRRNHYACCCTDVSNKDKNRKEDR